MGEGFAIPQSQGGQQKAQGHTDIEQHQDEGILLFRSRVALFGWKLAQTEAEKGFENKRGKDWLAALRACWPETQPPRNASNGDQRVDQSNLKAYISHQEEFIYKHQKGSYFPDQTLGANICTPSTSINFLAGDLNESKDAREVAGSAIQIARWLSESQTIHVNSISLFPWTWYTARNETLEDEVNSKSWD
ncbi:hypothetical protein BT63DRAFT_410231 [Microthyrium microscopicum]|uniref:Uncharacterized protein n=1 Tax=Microthyrium microscopicum TaxID=703497 RepID=A0A6A6UNB4_9PEZI|nr:hypothetical protein BT63DRAFT_410231 [Microthyrium microscopicum]